MNDKCPKDKWPHQSPGALVIPTPTFMRARVIGHWSLPLVIPTLTFIRARVIGHWSLPTLWSLPHALPSPADPRAAHRVSPKCSSRRWKRGRVIPSNWPLSSCSPWRVSGPVRSVPFRSPPGTGPAPAAALRAADGPPPAGTSGSCRADAGLPAAGRRRLAGQPVTTSASSSMFSGQGRSPVHRGPRRCTHPAAGLPGNSIAPPDTGTTTECPRSAQSAAASQSPACSAHRPGRLENRSARQAQARAPEPCAIAYSSKPGSEEAGQLGLRVQAQLVHLQQQQSGDPRHIDRLPACRRLVGNPRLELADQTGDRRLESVPHPATGTRAEPAAPRHQARCGDAASGQRVRDRCRSDRESTRASCPAQQAVPVPARAGSRDSFPLTPPGAVRPASASQAAAQCVQLQCFAGSIRFDDRSLRDRQDGQHAPFVQRISPPATQTVAERLSTAPEAWTRGTVVVSTCLAKASGGGHRLDAMSLALCRWPEPDTCNAVQSVARTRLPATPPGPHCSR